jgi:Beta-propeller repeat/Viral BACON domain
MKSSFSIPLAGVIFCATWISSALAAAPDPIKILQTAPLRFEPDAGAAGRFVARGTRFAMEFSNNQARMHSGDRSASLSFLYSDPRARIEGESVLRSKTNLFLGNDPAKWRRGVVNYERLQVTGLYPGVDLVYYGNAGELEYDLTVAPGADPGRIRLRLAGEKPELDADGNLIAGLIQKRPVAYQLDSNGVRSAVDSSYHRNRDGSYGFKLGPYDHSRALVIDPVLTYGLYLAGTATDIGYAIGHDQNGLIYIAGTTDSGDFPSYGTPTQSANKGNTDLWVAQINPALPLGQSILFTTYVGGSSTEIFGGLAVGPKGDIYLTGSTESVDLPLTSNTYQNKLENSAFFNAFVVWINSSQQLAYASYIGGSKASDTANAIAVDSHGRMWITGGARSTDFPTVAPYQSALSGGFSQDIFVAGFDPSQSGSATLIYSSYLGGSNWDTGRGIAVAADGTVWVAGGTYSFDAPVVNPYHADYSGGGDGYVAHIDPTMGSNGLLYATFVGGGNLDEARQIALDPAGPVIVSGYTLSQNYPVTSNALQTAYGGNTDAFITILNPAANANQQLVYSTYFGGSGPDVPFDLKRDSVGILYLSGMTQSAGLPATASAMQSNYDGSMDAFVLRLNPSKPGSSGRDYFTYLGSPGVQIGYGVDFDSAGNVYLVGSTTGPIFDPFGGETLNSSVGKTDVFLAGFSVCGFNISPLSQEFPENGGTGSITITAQGSDCPWTVVNTLNYVTVTPSSGTGSGTVTIAVSPNNTGAARQGTITVAGISYLVGQQGATAAARPRLEERRR